MITIRLRKGEWKYDPTRPLGPEGGFGEVFFGESADGKSAAIKRLKITASAAAHRELKVADWIGKKSFSHIMPCYDSGQDSESDMYFVVMPQAELSLETRIQQEGLLGNSESAKILLEIVNGLIEAGELVHRDMKPGNILYYESSWYIGDFGIAMFVEESTSLRTLKACLSPPYSAPEQWNYERATHATDAYALGCIGYTLLTGKPPFSGPTTADYKSQHLHDEPPPLSQSNPLLKSLLVMMLRKIPVSRPSLVRIAKILETILKEQVEANGKRFSALSKAGASVVQQQAEEESKQAKERSVRKRRQALAQQADTIFVQARKYVERVNIVDRLPPLVKIYERFGKEEPSKVDSANKRIEWNYEKLEAGETRILTYIIYSKVGVVGRFALPSTTAIYEKNGKIQEAESNRAFFVAEQTKKDIKEE